MSERNSGSSSVSLSSSARPEAMRLAQCWSLGCQAPASAGKLNARTCWRMTSGWNSGLDSTDMGIYELRFAIYKAGAKRAAWGNRFTACHGASGRPGDQRGKISVRVPTRHEELLHQEREGVQCWVSGGVAHGSGGDRGAWYKRYTDRAASDTHLRLFDSLVVLARPVSPHPGPLPWGEGEYSPASRRTRGA